MQIECLVRGEVEFNASAGAVLAALNNIQDVVQRMKGVRSVLHVGTKLFHFEFAARELLGVEYLPECIVRFDMSRLGHVTWGTIDGNLRFDGDLHVRPTAGGCVVRYAVREIADLPLAPMLVQGAEAVGRVDLNQRIRSLLGLLDVRGGDFRAAPVMAPRPARGGLMGFLRAGHA